METEITDHTVEIINSFKAGFSQKYQEILVTIL